MSTLPGSSGRTHVRAAVDGLGHGIVIGLLESNLRHTPLPIDAVPIC
jgi:hypothetical protein